MLRPVQCCVTYIYIVWEVQAEHEAKMRSQRLEDSRRIAEEIRQQQEAIKREATGGK